MATDAEKALNLGQFKETYYQVTPGIPGAKHEGELFSNARRAREGVDALLEYFAQGAPGVRYDGALTGMIRRAEANTQVVKELVSALAAANQGETIDVDALVERIGSSVADNTAEGIVRGLKKAEQETPEAVK